MLDPTYGCAEASLPPSPSFGFLPISPLSSLPFLTALASSRPGNFSLALGFLPHSELEAQALPLPAGEAPLQSSAAFGFFSFKSAELVVVGEGGAVPGPETAQGGLRFLAFGLEALRDLAALRCGARVVGDACPSSCAECVQASFILASYSSLCMYMHRSTLVEYMSQLILRIPIYVLITFKIGGYSKRSCSKNKLLETSLGYSKLLQEGQGGMNL